MFVLLSKMKNIFKTIFILILVNKNGFKKIELFQLILKFKTYYTIPKVFGNLSIFEFLISVFQIIRRNF